MLQSHCSCVTFHTYLLSINVDIYKQQYIISTLNNDFNSSLSGIYKLFQGFTLHNLYGYLIDIYF